MGTENDFDSFIQKQKQKLAQERAVILENRSREQSNGQTQPDTQLDSRKQWHAPERLDVNREEGLPLGQYDQKRRQIDDERKKEYQEQQARQNASQNRRQNNNDENESGLFNRLGQYEQKRKVLDTERKNEYNRLLNDPRAVLENTAPVHPSKAHARSQQAQNSVRTTGRPRAVNPNAEPLGGMRDHPSAQQSKIKQRNAEYNEFLKQNEEKTRNRFKEKKGQSRGPPPQELMGKSDNGPRRGWGTPTYDEILEQKRRQEMNYRRNDDPEMVPSSMPLNGQNYQRNYASESQLAAERRLEELDRQYEKKKVKFQREQPPNEGTADIYDWEQNERSKSFYNEPEPHLADPYSRSRSVPPEENINYSSGFKIGNESSEAERKKKQAYRRDLDRQVNAQRRPPEPNYQTGLPIGQEERSSAAQRRKDTYRRDLEQQMNKDQQTKRRQKQGQEPENRYPNPQVNQTTLPQAPYPSLGALQGPDNLLGDRRPLASILNDRLDLVDTSPRRPPGYNDYNPGVLDRGFTGLYEPSSIANRMNGPAPPINQQGQLPPGVPALNLDYGRTPADDYYNYYGARDPLAGQALPYNAPPAPQQQNYPPPQQGHQQQQQDQPLNRGPLPQGSNRDPNLQKQNKLDYQSDLKKQMEEKERQKAAKKAEQEAYDKKLQNEIENYNPFGRGGGGAPMKDQQGNVMADLRTMNKTPRAGTAEPPPVPAANTSAPSDYLTPRIDLQTALTPGRPLDSDQAGHARGGNGIFGEPKNDAQKTAMDRYKEDLKVQIEQKRKAAEEEKRKMKEEEEREMKRLEEDRMKIQKEFEAEQAKQKAKDEETRKKNEEMKQLAEEKRLAAEKLREEQEAQRKEHEEERRRKEQQDREAEKPIHKPSQDTSGERSSSPPIPTLRSKTDGAIEVRQKSPPLPATRSKSQPNEEGFVTSKPPRRPTSKQQQPSNPSRPESRAKSAEVLNQLASMRKQLQQERQRVESALEKQKFDVDVYDPRGERPESGRVDVFEVARNKNPVSVRRPPADSPDPSTTNEFNELRTARPPGTATSLLQSDSAFIDTTGARTSFPEDFEALASNQNARRKRRERLNPNNPENEEFSRILRQYVRTPSDPDDMLTHYSRQPKAHVPMAKKRDADNVSLASINPDRINKKNQDRLKKLKAIAGDDISLADPDDIIDRFMTKQNHHRPPSGQTLNDESWIRAGSR